MFSTIAVLLFDDRLLLHLLLTGARKIQLGFPTANRWSELKPPARLRVEDLRPLKLRPHRFQRFRRVDIG